MTHATFDELVDVTIAVAGGSMAVEALAIWSRQRLTYDEA